METITLRIDEDIDAGLESISRQTGINRANVVRFAIRTLLREAKETGSIVLEPEPQPKKEVEAS